MDKYFSLLPRCRLLQKMFFLGLEGAQINISPCCRSVCIYLQGAHVCTARIATIKKKRAFARRYPTINTHIS